MGDTDKKKLDAEVIEILIMCEGKKISTVLTFCEVILDTLKTDSPEEYVEFMLFLNNQFLNSGLVERPDGVRLH